MYENTKAKYNLGVLRLAECVRSNRGVRQSSSLSPVLFALYIKEIAMRVKERSVGMRIGNNSILMDADDIIIMRDTSEELQEMLHVVN